MKPRDIRELVLLGALWGASFLFMRMGATAFGPPALAFVRVAGAALMLLPLVAMSGDAAALRRHWRAIAVVGVVNSALPFVLFMVASLVLSAALMSMLNATAPIWGAIVARAWLGERLTASRVAGLVIGLAGVAFLAWDRVEIAARARGIGPGTGIAACVLGAMSYGVAANVSRRFLAGVPPMAQAAGSQLAAALVLALPAAWAWPAVAPSVGDWLAAAALALACTGLAYVLYFRLIAHAGASHAVSVTFLVPGFAMLWGWLFLGERPTPTMLAGGAVVLFGTALALGLLRWPRGRAAAAAGRMAAPPPQRNDAAS